MLKQLAGALILLTVSASFLTSCTSKKADVDIQATLPPEERYVSGKGIYAIKFGKRPWEFSEMRHGRVYQTANLDAVQGKLKVAFCDLRELPKPPYDLKKQNAILDDDCGKFAETLKATQTEKKDLTVFGCPTRDVRGTLNSGIMLGGQYRARLLISDRRLYELSAIGTQQFVDSPEVNEFFATFDIPKSNAESKVEDTKAAP